MKYEVMKTFRGSPDGRFAVDYTAGETVELTDSLAEVALAEGWVKTARKTAAKSRAPQTKRKR
jgi:hypothetical protein